MTDEQKAAYVIGMSVCAYIKAQGMIAENKQRERQGLALAYTEEAFDNLITETGIHHNGLMTLLRG